MSSYTGIITATHFNTSSTTYEIDYLVVAGGGQGGDQLGGGGGAGYTDGSVEVLDSRLGATFGIPDYSFTAEYDENGTYGKVVIGLDL